MNLIRRKTIEINGAHITVRSANGWTAMDRRAILRALYSALGTLNEATQIYEMSPRIAERILVLADLIAHTEKVEGDLGFVWPGESASDTELIALVAAMEDLPSDAIPRWLNAIGQVNEATGDLDLAPEADESANPK